MNHDSHSTTARLAAAAAISLAACGAACTTADPQPTAATPTAMTASPARYIPDRPLDPPRITVNGVSVAPESYSWFRPGHAGPEVSRPSGSADPASAPLVRRSDRGLDLTVAAKQAPRELRIDFRSISATGESTGPESRISCTGHEACEEEQVDGGFRYTVPVAEGDQLVTVDLAYPADTTREAFPPMNTASYIFRVE